MDIGKARGRANQIRKCNIMANNSAPFDIFQLWVWLVVAAAGAESRYYCEKSSPRAEQKEHTTTPERVKARKKAGKQKHVQTAEEEIYIFQGSEIAFTTGPDVKNKFQLT